MIKRGVGSGAAKLPKICDFDLKNDFFAKKDRKKSQKPFQKILSILDIEGLILATKEGLERDACLHYLNLFH